MKIETMPVISLYELLQNIKIQFDLSLDWAEVLDEMGCDSCDEYFCYDYGHEEDDIYCEPAIVCIRSYLRDVIPNSKKVLIRI